MERDGLGGGDAADGSEADARGGEFAAWRCGKGRRVDDDMSGSVPDVVDVEA